MKSHVRGALRLCSAVVATAARANCPAFRRIVLWSFPQGHLLDTKYESALLGAAIMGLHCGLVFNIYR